MGAVGKHHQFHVLVVDDSVIDRKLIEKLLETSSVQVTAVDTVSKALGFLGFQDDEKESACCNHHESSSLKDIPGVIMSSENKPSRIKRCFKKGSDDFFLKPVKQSDVNKLTSVLVRGNSRISKREKPTRTRYQ